MCALPIVSSLVIHSLGELAFQLLQEPHAATLLGITSRGVFMETDSHWVIFLSMEQFRGPLTINMPEFSRLLRNIPAKAVAHTGQGRLILPDVRLDCQAERSTIWRPPAVHTNTVAHPALIRERMKSLVTDVTHLRGGTRPITEAPTQGRDDFYFLLPLLLPGSPYGSAASLTDTISQNVHRLQAVLTTRDPEKVMAAAIPFLGYGRGLTPSGDDVLSGMLLTLNRWLYPSWPTQALLALNQSLTSLAYEKTTTLSANLIECASLGVADERLVASIDYIMEGKTDARDIAMGLVGWGSSSGIDALTGMVIALVATLAFA
jgi:hypothetical protein